MSDRWALDEITRLLEEILVELKDLKEVVLRLVKISESAPREGV
ncbi:MAG: hypothetical protein ACETVR_04705 [Candidatus Bathyarchaeia archaeon]